MDKHIRNAIVRMEMGGVSVRRVCGGRNPEYAVGIANIMVIMTDQFLLEIGKNARRMTLSDALQIVEDNSDALPAVCNLD